MLVSVMLIAIVIILILIQKLTIKSWIDPSIVYTLYWAFFVIGAITVLGSEYNWKYWAEGWLIIALIVFYIGHFLGLSFYPQKKIILKDEKKYYNKKAWVVLLGIIGLGIFRTIIEMSVNNVDFKSLTNLNALVNVNTSIAAKRYSEGTASTPLMQVLSIFTYVAPLIGGYMFIGTKSRKEKLICFATFAPILSSVLLTNGKAGFIASFFLFISGLLVRLTEVMKNIKRLNIKRLLIGTFVLILVIGILIIAMMLRIGEFNIGTLNIVFKKFLGYGFGHMQAFDNWFVVMDKSSYTYGGYTFMAIFKNLGLLERSRGVYKPVLGVTSNVFTAYRGMIHDFGVIGGIIFNLLSGTVSGYFYGCLKWGTKFKILSRVTVSAMYFFIFYSFILSPWTYTSYILVFPLFYAYLWITRKWKIESWQPYEKM